MWIAKLCTKIWIQFKLIIELTKLELDWIENLLKTCIQIKFVETIEILGYVWIMGQ